MGGKDLTTNTESGSSASNWELNSKTTEGKKGSTRGHSLTKENTPSNPSNVTEVGTKSLTPPPLPDKAPLHKKLNEKKINTLISQMNEAKKELETCKLMVETSRLNLKLGSLELGNLTEDSEDMKDLIPTLSAAEKALQEAEQHYAVIKKEYEVAVKASAPKSILEIAPESRIEKSIDEEDIKAVDKELGAFEDLLKDAQQKFDKEKEGKKGLVKVDPKKVEGNASKVNPANIKELELAHTHAKRFFELFKKNCDVTHPGIFKSRRSEFEVRFNEKKRCIEVAHPKLEKKAIKGLQGGESEAYRKQFIHDLENMLRGTSK